MKLPWFLRQKQRMRFNALIRQKTALALSAGLGGFVTMANLASAQLWNPCAPTGPRLAAYHNTWQTVATSADGTKLVAGGGVYDNDCNFCGSRWSGDAIYFSTNGGATWKASGPTDIWQAIASSADGTKLVAVAQAANGSGGIYTSTNSGLTWTAWTNMPANVWSAVASSSDGTRLFAVAGLQIATQWLQGDGSIYTSTNSGATWTRTSAPTNDWTAVASSADGTRLVGRRGTAWRRPGKHQEVC